MGLDIMLGTPVTQNNEDVYTIILSDKNKFHRKVMEMFPNFIEEVETEYYDFKKYFSSINLNIDDWEWFTSQLGIDETIYTFVKKTDVDKLFSVSSKNIPYIITENEKVLKYIEIKYQRDSMKPEFYSDFLKGACWYKQGYDSNINIHEHDIPDIICTKEDFEKVLQYANENANIHKWKFEEGKHIIEFSY